MSESGRMVRYLVPIYSNSLLQNGCQFVTRNLYQLSRQYLHKYRCKKLVNMLINSTIGLLPMVNITQLAS